MSSSHLPKVSSFSLPHGDPFNHDIKVYLVHPKKGLSSTNLSQALFQMTREDFLQCTQEALDEVNSPEAGTALCVHEGTRVALVFHLSTVTIEMVVHEVVHCVTRIMDSIGCHLADASEEVYAYLTGNITKGILEHLKKLGVTLKP